MLIKVRENKSLVRDSKNRAILTDDSKAYEDYMSKKYHRQNVTKRMDAVETDINSIKSELDDIKDLLMTIANKL